MSPNQFPFQKEKARKKQKKKNFLLVNNTCQANSSSLIFYNHFFKAKKSVGIQREQKRLKNKTRVKEEINLFTRSFSFLNLTTQQVVPITIAKYPVKILYFFIYVCKKRSKALEP